MCERVEHGARVAHQAHGPCPESGRECVAGHDHSVVQVVEALAVHAEHRHTGTAGRAGNLRLDHRVAPASYVRVGEHHRGGNAAGGHLVEDRWDARRTEGDDGAVDFRR